MRARRLQAGAGLLILVAAIGTVGYWSVEDLSLFDSLFFTVITISTVGFSEPPGGFSTGGQILSMFLVIAGVGSALYTATAGIEMGLEKMLGGQWQRRRMERRVADIDNHIILCGFGTVGRNVWKRLDNANEPSVVVERNEETAAKAIERGATVIIGDATQDEVLHEAGIERAKSLITAVRNDADNLFIVLSAKTARPDLIVVARATELEAERKLALAGADRVVAPQIVGAHRLAALAVQTELEDFVDLTVHGELVEYRVEQFEVVADAPIAGKTLRESNIRELAGASILAVQGADGIVEWNPGPEFRLAPGQVMFGIGTAPQVSELRTLACEPG